MTRYCMISHRLDGLLPDKEGADDEVTGHVVFTPVLSRGDAYTVDELDGNGPTTIIAAPVTARILDGHLTHDGELGVRLFAGGPGSNPEVVRWKAVFRNLKINLAKAELRDIIFDAIPGGTINLASVQPPAGAPPVGILLMKGDPGPPGDSGAGGSWALVAALPASPDPDTLYLIPED